MSPHCAFSAIVIVASLSLTSSLSAQSPSEAAADEATHPGATATMPPKALTNAAPPGGAPSLTPAELEDLNRVKFDKVYTAGRAVASAQYLMAVGVSPPEISTAQSEVLQGVVDRGGCRNDHGRESIVPTVPDSSHEVRHRNRPTRRQRIVGLEGQSDDAGGGGSPRRGEQDLSRESLSVPAVAAQLQKMLDIRARQKPPDAFAITWRKGQPIKTFIRGDALDLACARRAWLPEAPLERPPQLQAAKHFRVTE